MCLPDRHPQTVPPPSRPRQCVWVRVYSVLVLIWALLLVLVGMISLVCSAAYTEVLLVDGITAAHPFLIYWFRKKSNFNWECFSYCEPYHIGTIYSSITGLVQLIGIQKHSSLCIITFCQNDPHQSSCNYAFMVCSTLSRVHVCMRKLKENNNNNTELFSKPSWAKHCW